MKFPEVKEFKEHFSGELAERGDWLVANVDTRTTWPVLPQWIEFRGHKIWILPVTKDHFPAVAMRIPAGVSREDGELLLMRFLSALCWVESFGVLVDGVGGGSRPVPMGTQKRFHSSICEEFNLSYLPEPDDEKALLAMALMREGRALNHPAYAFLSFYRVLEVALPDGRARGRWMAEQIDQLKHFRAKEAIEKLMNSGVDDVANHLRDSNRKAIAHANQQPVIDPDKPSERRRLWSELPIIEALAERAIEECLGIETSGTVYSKHFYELAGFKKVLGSEIVNCLAEGQPLENGQIGSLPAIRIAVRKKEAYEGFSDLLAADGAQEGSKLHLLFLSEDGKRGIELCLDFEEERCHFDIFSGVFVHDDGSAEAALHVAEAKRFFMDYFGNGELQIFDSESGALLSRKDAYMPLNMYGDYDVMKKDIEKWRLLAEERKGLPPKPPHSAHAS